MKKVLFVHIDQDKIIPVVAFRLWRRTSIERSVLEMAGLDEDSYILITDLDSTKTHWSPNEWDTDEMAFAHKYIVDNWDAIQSGMRVDVRALLSPITLDNFIRTTHG